jgi:ATP-binding cassette subfamily B protein
MYLIKRFSKYYREHLPLFFLDFGSAFVMSGLDLVFPFAVSKMIDQVLPSRNLELLILMGAGLLSITIVKFILQYIVDYWGHVLGVRMEYAMRKEYMAIYPANKSPCRINFFRRTKIKIINTVKFHRDS